MCETFHMISDCSCDLSLGLAQEKSIPIVPFYASFEGERHQEKILKLASEIFISIFFLPERKFLSSALQQNSAVLCSRPRPKKTLYQKRIKMRKLHNCKSSQAVFI